MQRMSIDELSNDIKLALKEIEEFRNDKLIIEPFYKDFTYRFCWSSNSLEGNTLSLEETIKLIDYDEVNAQHTFGEYSEAKNLYRAIKKHLSFASQNISEEWIKDVNSEIITSNNDYRKEDVFIGNIAEAIYYPPTYEDVPTLMNNFSKDIDFSLNDIKDIINKVSETHIQFERIHPFLDGNGRTGRMILNQSLINNGLLPICIEKNSKYRQAFKLYDKNEDISMLSYIIAKEELNSINIVKELAQKRTRSLLEKAPTDGELVKDEEKER